MYDVITIGSAFQDVYVFSKKFKVVRDSRAATGEMQMFTFGTKIELDDILFEIGGGATNTAFTFARQGLRVACITRVGSDGAGEEVARFFKQAGIGNKLIIDKKSRTAHSVVFLGKNGERTILVYRGAAHNFQSQDISEKSLSNTKWLYITSLAGNLPALEKILKFACRKNIKVALNPGKLEIRQSKKRIAQIFKMVDLLLLNREEAVLINKRAYGDHKGLISDLHLLCPNVVVVTGGKSGSIISDGKNIYNIKITPVKAVDTTGAGDAFGSAFLSGLIKYKGNIRKSAILACNNSAAVVKKIGAKHGLLSGKSALKNAKISFSKLKK